jgi:hypothetical protein
MNIYLSHRTCNNLAGSATASNSPMEARLDQRVGSVGTPGSPMRRKRRICTRNMIVEQDCDFLLVSYYFLYSLVFGTRHVD